MATRNGSSLSEAPLDDETRRRREALAKLEKMSPDELVQIAVRAGILSKQHKLTRPYRNTARPSAARPKD